MTYNRVSDELLTDVVAANRADNRTAQSPSTAWLVQQLALEVQSLREYKRNVEEAIFDMGYYKP